MNRNIAYPPELLHEYAPTDQLCHYCLLPGDKHGLACDSLKLRLAFNGLWYDVQVVSRRVLARISRLIRRAST